MAAVVRLLKIPPFYRDLLIAIGDEGELNKGLTKFLGKEKADEVTGKLEILDTSRGKTYINTKDNIFFVWLPELPNDNERFGFLIHELFHATVAALNSIGAIPSDDSEEVYAYVLGYLTERMLTEFNASISFGREPASKHSQPKS